jgi:hypothetical protein
LLRKLLTVRPMSSPKFAEITVSVPFSTPTGDYTHLPLGGVLTEIEILRQLTRTGEIRPQSPSQFSVSGPIGQNRR